MTDGTDRSSANEGANPDDNDTGVRSQASKAADAVSSSHGRLGEQIEPGGRVMDERQINYMIHGLFPADLVKEFTDEEGNTHPYVEPHVLDAIATKIFGDQWSTSIVAIEPLPRECVNGKLLIGYRAIIRVTVRSCRGDAEQHHEGMAVSYSVVDANDVHEIARAHQMNTQGARTKAQRWALGLFGECFGGLLMRDREGTLERARAQRSERRNRHSAAGSSGTAADRDDGAPTSEDSPRNGNRTERQSGEGSETDTDARKTDVDGNRAGTSRTRGSGARRRVKVRDGDNVERSRCVPESFPAKLKPIVDRADGPEEISRIFRANRRTIDELPADTRGRVMELLDGIPDRIADNAGGNASVPPNTETGPDGGNDADTEAETETPAPDGGEGSSGSGVRPPDLDVRPQWKRNRERLDNPDEIVATVEAAIERAATIEEVDALERIWNGDDHADVRSALPMQSRGWLNQAFGKRRAALRT